MHASGDTLDAVVALVTLMTVECWRRYSQDGICDERDIQGFHLACGTCLIQQGDDVSMHPGPKRPTETSRMLCPTLRLFHCCEKWEMRLRDPDPLDEQQIEPRKGRWDMLDILD